MKHNCIVCNKIFTRKGTTPAKYCSHRCYWSTMKGMKPFHYKGGKVIRQNGYLAIYKPSHPNCTKDGYVLEHRLIMEKHIGRYLDPKEVVHHKNHKTDDNRIDNLELFDNHSSHLSHERSGIKRKPFSDKWKENIRKGRIEWLAKHSHPNS